METRGDGSERVTAMAYLKGGEVVAATGGIQSKAQVKEIIDQKLA